MCKIWNDYLRWRNAFPEDFAPIMPPDITPEAEAKRAEQLGLGLVEDHSGWLWVREWDGTAAVERPVYLDEEIEQRIEGYFGLAQRRPDLFAPSAAVPICMDRLTMLRYMENTGRPVGLVYDNGNYYKVAADLIDAPKPYTYARVLYPDAGGNGTVVIPRLLSEGPEPLFGILHVFRHTIRAMAGGEFPRGFQAARITAAQNAIKELEEEFGVPGAQLAGLTLLGHTRADTGLSSGHVQIYLADLKAAHPPQASVGQEGIVGFEWISLAELLRRIREGKILDGFTQTALLQYLMYETKIG